MPGIDCRKTYEEQRPRTTPASRGPVGSPGQPVRLRYGYVDRATGVLRNSNREVVEVHAEYLPETRGGTPGANSVKTKAAIPLAAGGRQHPRRDPRLRPPVHGPETNASDANFLSVIIRDSKHVLRAFVEPSLAYAKPNDKFQFERNGFFVADLKDHSWEMPVSNLAVTLKDS